jgi:hypothetical protein
VAGNIAHSAQKDFSRCMYKNALLNSKDLQNSADIFEAKNISSSYLPCLQKKPKKKQEMYRN